MIEFDFAELNLLHKLLNAIKYSELDAFELNQFANSPITNRVMEKIQTEFKPLTEKIPRIKSDRAPKFEFKMENHVGKAITNRLEYLDLSSFRAIAGWNKTETEKFARAILGIIDYKESEFHKLTAYITEKAKEKTDNA